MKTSAENKLSNRLNFASRFNLHNTINALFMSLDTQRIQVCFLLEIVIGLTEKHWCQNFQNNDIKMAIIFNKIQSIIQRRKKNVYVFGIRVVFSILRHT